MIVQHAQADKIQTWSGLMSTATVFLPAASATMLALPDPQHKSTTVSPGSENLDLSEENQSAKGIQVP